MDIREQIEWWKRAEKKGCVDSCPYWSELSGFLYTVEAMLEVVEAVKRLDDARSIEGLQEGSKAVTDAMEKLKALQTNDD